MSDDDRSPACSAAEMSAIVLDFLTFLTTLHRDPADLRMPPPGGWPGYTPENCAGFKSDLTIDVLRHLPYLGWGETDYDDSRAHIHYKSRLIDYSAFDRAAFTGNDYLWEGYDDDGDDGDVPVPEHVFLFAEGYESGGRTVFVDLLEGRVVEIELRCDTRDLGIREYFADLKEKFRNLELIPVPGREMIEVRSVPVTIDEAGGTVTEEEVLAQDQDFFGYTDLDVRYARQLYRSFGWPDDFRRDEAFRAMAGLKEKREAG
jgi:hypothetical protein